MPNKSLPMDKLRTIIRLYTERVGLRAIAELSRTSRNSVKKLCKQVELPKPYL